MTEKLAEESFAIRLLPSVAGSWPLADQSLVAAQYIYSFSMPSGSMDRL